MQHVRARVADKVGVKEKDWPGGFFFFSFFLAQPDVFHTRTYTRFPFRFHFLSLTLSLRLSLSHPISHFLSLSLFFAFALFLHNVVHARRSLDAFGSLRRSHKKSHVQRHPAVDDVRGVFFLLAPKDTRVRARLCLLRRRGTARVLIKTRRVFLASCFASRVDQSRARRCLVVAVYRESLES